MTLARNLLLIALFAPTLAHAQKKGAKKPIELAMEAHAAGNFELALTHLTAAYDADPQPDLLYAIAQVEQKLDRCRDAVTHYEQFLNTNPPATAETDTREAIATCNARIAAEAPPVVITPPPPVAVTPPPRASPWWTDPLGLGLLGGGVLATAIGVVVYADARSDLDAAETAADHASYDDLVDGARGKRTASAVLVGGGIALIAGGVVRLVLRDRAAQETRPSVAIVPVSGGSMVTWGGSF